MSPDPPLPGTAVRGGTGLDTVLAAGCTVNR